MREHIRDVSLPCLESPLRGLSKSASRRKADADADEISAELFVDNMTGDQSRAVFYMLGLSASSNQEVVARASSRFEAGLNTNREGGLHDLLFDRGIVQR